MIIAQTYNGGYVNFDGFYLSNSSLGGFNGFVVNNDNSNNPSYVTSKNFYFENVTLLSSSYLIKWEIVKQLVIHNFTFDYIIQKDPIDTTNMMFNIRGLDMNTTGQFLISSISVQNSSVSLMNLMNVINSNISTVNLVSISDISYTNSNLKSSDNLVTLSSIEVNAALNISINNVLMSNIAFANKGVLMLFEQQTNLIVVVTNCLFENTVNATLHFEPYNKNNPTLLTNMKFVNMTVRNSNAYFKSFMDATAGAVISIYNSVFVNNCNFLSGSVVSAGSKGTSFRFYNSTFQNNTSVQGGVFYVENQGTITLLKLEQEIKNKLARIMARCCWFYLQVSLEIFTLLLKPNKIQSPHLKRLPSTLLLTASSFLISVILYNLFPVLLSFVLEY